MLFRSPPQRIRSPDMSHTASVLPPQARPSSATGRPMVAPPSRLTSLSQGPPHIPNMPQTTPSQYAPPSRVMGHGQTPPPGPPLLNRPPSSQPPLPQPGGPYGPPTSAGIDGLPPQQYLHQHQPSLAGPYDLPPVQQQSAPPTQGPPPQVGQPPPPGGPARVASRASAAAKPQPAAPKYRMLCHSVNFSVVKFILQRLVIEVTSPTMLDPPMNRFRSTSTG